MKSFLKIGENIICNVSNSLHAQKNSLKACLNESITKFEVLIVKMLYWIKNQIL